MPPPPLPRALTDRLAVEITHGIIDQLSGDRVSLEACTRVGWEWLHKGRYHLFSRVSVDAGNYKEFAKLLETPSSTFDPSTIRGLVVANAENATVDEEKAFERALAIPPFSTIPKLEVIYSDIRYTHDKALRWVTNYAARLRELYVNLPHGVSFAEFTLVVSELTNLRCIGVKQWLWESPVLTTLDAPVPPLLRSLICGGLGMYFLFWVTGHANHPPLLAFHFRGSNGEGEPGVYEKIPVKVERLEIRDMSQCEFLSAGCVNQHLRMII